MDDTNLKDLRNWEEKTKQRAEVAVALESSLFIFIEMFALVGNIFVCLAVYRNKSLRSITHIFIVALSVSDLIMAVVFLPLSVGASITGQWLYGELLCQIQGSAVLIWGAFSLAMVSITAVNRYFRVVKPTLYRTIFTMKSTAIIIAVTFLLTTPLISGTPQALGVKFTFGPHLFCIPIFPTRTIQMAVVLPTFFIYILIPMLTIFICYSKVFRKVRRHALLVAPSLANAQNPLAKRDSKRETRRLKAGVEEIKITNVVFTVLVVFFLLWTPICVIGTLFVTGVFLPRWSHLMYDYLIFLNTAANPIVYGLFNKAFRAEYGRILGCRTVQRRNTLTMDNTEFSQRIA